MDRNRPESLEDSQLALLVASVRDYAIFMLDPSGHIRSWNVGARQLKGYEPEEAIGRHFSMFYTDADRDRDHPAYELEVAIRDGRYEEEGWRVRKDGSTFWASVTITAVRDEHGDLAGFAKVTRDLSERREAEEQLRRANHELERFAVVAAHDMSDPLRTITGFAELLERGGLSEDEATEYVGHIRASSVRLTEMLRGLLAYARAGGSAPGTERVPLAAVVERVLAELLASISERDVELEVAVPTEATVRATSNDVHLVLQNLIANAIKFANPQRPRVRVSARQDGGAWTVAVEDNGAGVAEADRERIFGAFERAGSGSAEPGYGLGLAIAERLVERHGGRIAVADAPGGGSSFSFTLIGVFGERASG